MNDPQPSRTPNDFFVILVLGFLFRVTSLGFDRVAYTVLLPGIKRDLGLTHTHMGFFQVE